MAIETSHNVNSHAFGAAGAKVGEDMEHTIFHDSS
jgi:hypothetical protein